MKICLFEIMYSEFRTRMLLKDRVDWAIIEYDLFTEKITFHTQFQKNKSIDARIDPFELDSKRFFLVVYPHKVFSPGRIEEE